MSTEEQNDQIYLGKTILREGNGDNFSMLTKSTLSIQNAVNMVNVLTEIIESVGADNEEERIHLTSFLKTSQYSDDAYFGNLKVELVEKPADSAPKKKKFTAKSSGVKSSTKDRIKKFKQG